MTEKRCAFLTMDNTAGWSIDADLAIPPLAERGWQVEWIPWRQPDCDWDAFDAVYIGTPWDYPENVPQFIAELERIDRSSAVLVNDLQLVRWNIAKTYLRDLEARGAAIVPSVWPGSLAAGLLADLFDRLASERLIVKPVISTNASDTFLLDRELAKSAEDELLRTFASRPCVVQPFLGNVQVEGEYSLFYFAQQYSHAICKVPKTGDFRVQEEHGAGIVAVSPDPRMLEVACAIMRLVEPTPVYARCDLVRGDDGRYLLMELELIEPSLYLRMDQAAPERFAAEFDRYVSRPAAALA